LLFHRIKFLRKLDIPKSQWFLVILLWLCYAVLEGAGIGLFLPILVYIEEGGIKPGGDTDIVVRAVLKVFEFTGIEISFAILLMAAAIPLLLRLIFQYIKTVVSARIEHQYEAKLRSSQIHPYLGADIPFFLKNNQGEVVSGLLVDIARARSVSRTAIDAIGGFTLLLIYVLLAFLVVPALTLMVISFFAFSGWIVRSQKQRVQRRGAAISDASKEFSRLVTESFQAIRLVKMRAAEHLMEKALLSKNEELVRCQFNIQRISAAVDAMIQPVLMCGVLGTLYLAFEMLHLRLADLGLFMFLLLRAMPVVSQINQSRMSFSGNLHSLYRIERLREEAVRCQETDTGILKFKKLEKGIIFSGVSFSYERKGKSVSALNDVSFTVPRGDTVALVGPSGAGKSTTVDLIARFYSPKSGDILIDGTPIREYTLKSLRRKIAFVTQDVAMFHDTVRANLCFGLSPEVPEEKIRDCLRKSQAAEFVDELSEGVDTVIGERGMRLSGGQRQRLSLARALIQDPEILILDEPTSALDSVSEAAIHAALKSLHGQVTIIVIAHRLATVRGADLILVMDEGQIVSQGTHADLCKQEGIYRTLAEMQHL